MKGISDHLYVFVKTVLQGLAVKRERVISAGDIILLLIMDTIPLELKLLYIILRESTYNTRVLVFLYEGEP